MPKKCFPCALDDFRETFASGYLAEEIAPKLMCESLNVLLALLHKEDHVTWLREHVADCDDLAAHDLTEDQVREWTRRNGGL